jgi:electron transport complex protein RnfB
MSFLVAVLVFAILGLVLGSVLGWSQRAFHVEGDPLVDELESMLPGGQCGQCGEVGCRPAAEAMVKGSLTPDQCPPGGRSLAKSIATLLGVELGDGGEDIQFIAVIDEDNCSGCGRCFKACPFDAIVGANKQMHTVMTSICTGCRLCEKSCQQDCLTMEPLPTNLQTWLWPKPEVA